MIVRAVLFFALALAATAAPEFVHDHRVRAAMGNAGGDQVAFSLPDAFNSFGHFEFIETLEGAQRGQEAAASGSEGSEDSGKTATDGAAAPHNKPIPKKLKCSCSFAKLDAPAPSLFLEAMEKPRLAARHAMLRSSQ